QLKLQSVGVRFDRRQAVQGDQVAEDKKLLPEVRSHCRLVVGGVVEDVGFAGQADGAERGFKPFPPPSNRGRVSAKRRHEEESGGMGADMGHWRSRVYRFALAWRRASAKK